MGDNIGKIVYWKIPYNTVSFSTRYHHQDLKNLEIMGEHCIIFLHLQITHRHSKMLSNVKKRFGLHELDLYQKPHNCPQL